MTTHKKCIKCKRNLHISCFAKRGGENYLRTECRECNNNSTNIRKTLKNKYGLPPADYSCPICGRNGHECAGQGGKELPPWVIDHCHKTNEFRGWLCHKCNRSLGGFNDDVELLNKAINYLTSTASGDFENND